ncbi:14578_t:CDS:2, partial [Ambispora leptoticha]
MKSITPEETRNSIQQCNKRAIIQTHVQQCNSISNRWKEASSSQSALCISSEKLADYDSSRVSYSDQGQNLLITCVFPVSRRMLLFPRNGTLKEFRQLAEEKFKNTLVPVAYKTFDGFIIDLVDQEDWNVALWEAIRNKENKVKRIE